MAVKQLSVFAENKSGSLLRITEVLAAEGLDLRSICIADTEKFGIIRVIVNDTEKAEKVLRENGFMAASKEVVAVAIPDVPGGLSRVLRLLDEENINLEYMYSVISGWEGQALMVLRVNDNRKTEEVLSENGIGILKEEDL